jgi:polyphosphate kinase
MYQTHGEVFRLLYDINKLNVMDEPDVLKSYKDMHLVLEKYLDEIDLFEKVKILNIINNKLSELYPIMIIALKVLLTIPITLASAEHSFSKLKLLNKSHLSSMITQENFFFCLCYQ